MQPSRPRRLTCCVILPIVLAATAAPAQAGAQTILPELAAQAAATPKTIALGKTAVIKNARAFTRLSKCPVRVLSAKYVSSVKRTTVTKSAARIVNASIFPTVSKSGKCTGVLSIRSARRAGKIKASAVVAYRKQLRGSLKQGSLLYRLSWRTKSGRRFSTLAAVSPKGALIFDPLISTFLKPVPDSAAPPTETPQAGAVARQALGPAVTRFTWRPFGARGRCIAVDLLGFCRVRKFVNMLIFVDVYGRITSEAESASVSATLANARRRIKAELINDGKCKKFTVEVYWTSPIGSIGVKAGTKGFDLNLTISGIGSNGVDSEVFVLCGDGSGQVV